METSDSNLVSKKKGSGNFVFLLIIILLLGALAYMSVQLSKRKTELNQCMNDNKALKTDMEGMNNMMSGYVDNMSNDLTVDFQNMLKTYDALKEKDKTKADSIEAQKAKINGLLSELQEAKNSGKLNGRIIAKLQRENETLRKIMKSYVVQIDSLNTLNLKLTSDLDQTTNKLNSTTVERDQYKQEMEQKSELVKKGSKLSAYNFSSAGLRMKMNNMPEETNKARNVVQIKSSFTISDNPIAQSGKKTVYLQVVNPDGKTLQTKSSNVLQTDGGAIPFSDKKDIDYNNERIDMSIYYDLRGEEAIKGNYKVKIYCDGSLIGSDSFTLK